ncbi:MAG: hypothetical protein LBQ22_00075 [Bacteroidales bacterium]|jgi:uncharacterized membrane protein YphA (DoxX/SURF4 family)|nr:hypothetical protein [Bacteroidales bacterium]
MKIFITIIRILLGFVFLCSACFKLISADEFELYIYSHNILSLNLSIVAARLVIGFEFFIGLMLIINIYSKQIWYISVITLFIFTIYLAIVAISGNTDNCHCFGEILRMTPLESIIKNIILLALFLPLRKESGYNFKYKIPVTVIVFLIGFSIPMIVSPPDFLFSEKYAEMAVVNEDGFETIIFNNEDFPIDLTKGKRVVCFYSPSCRFCRLSEKKTSSMIVRNDLAVDSFVNIFWGNPEELDQFYSDNSISYQQTFIPMMDFFKITEGKMPLILLVEDGKIVEKFGYRGIDEKIIVSFLSE